MASIIETVKGSSDSSFQLAVLKCFLSEPSSFMFDSLTSTKTVANIISHVSIDCRCCIISIRFRLAQKSCVIAHLHVFDICCSWMQRQSLSFLRIWWNLSAQSSLCCKYSVMVKFPTLLNISSSPWQLIVMNEMHCHSTATIRFQKLLTLLV